MTALFNNLPDLHIIFSIVVPYIFYYGHLRPHFGLKCTMSSVRGWELYFAVLGHKLLYWYICGKIN